MKSKIMTRTASSWLMMMWRRYKLHSHLIGKRRRRTESRSIRLRRRWRWRRSGFRAEANSTLTQICSGNSLLLHFVLSPRFDMAKKTRDFNGLDFYERVYEAYVRRCVIGEKGLLQNIKHKFQEILQPFTYQNVGQCLRVKKTAASKTHLDNDLVC